MTEQSFERELGVIRVGVSACLLGAKVRFDGGHKRNRFLDDVLRKYFEFVPVCPEIAIGLGTPRETLRITGSEDRPRVTGSRNPALDVTEDLRGYGKQFARDRADLCGFVFKKGSPSCGMERVRIYNDKGMPHANGVGLFADEIMKANPILPVEEEGRLNDPVLRENFINRVFVYARWRAMLASGLSKGGLVSFHARHKLLIMAHSTEGYRELGRLVANLNVSSLDEIAWQYIRQLMDVLGQRATRKRHSNVLQHLMGYLRKRTDGGDRAELVETIDAYRRGEYPLVVPIRLLSHHFRRHPHPYVSQQVYLDPYPSELMLRNAV